MADDKPRAVQLNEDDVVLVTGGARGITAECALALGKQSGATFVLLGRSSDESSQEALSTIRL